MSAALYIPDMLQTLRDVSILTPLPGHALMFDGSQWANRTIQTEDVSGLQSTLDDLATYGARLDVLSTFQDSIAVEGLITATNSGSPTITLDGTTGEINANVIDGIHTGSGSNLTALNAANISSGTLDAARLPATATLTNTVQTITAAKTHSANINVSSGSNVVAGSLVISAANSAIMGNGVSPVRLMGHNTGGGTLIYYNGSQISTSGTWAACSIIPTYNQTSGTAANTDLLINRTQTAVGSGAQRLFDTQVGSAPKFYIRNDGVLFMANTSVPLAAPIGGVFLWAENGELMGMFPSGSYYSIAS